MKKVVVGVDIGGSHISAQLIDLDLKTEVENTWIRRKIDSNAGAEDIIEAWASAIESCMESLSFQPHQINIAIPGPMDYETGICKIKDQGKYENLYGLNVKNLLESRLAYSSTNINLVNDAECFLKGELFNGSLVGMENAIGVTLGTGLGTSHTENGKIYDSDLWRMPFKDGIAEDYISTRWFIGRFFELGEEHVSGVQELIDIYKDSLAFKRLFEEFSENLATFLITFAQAKQPDGVVLGGNIAKAHPYFLAQTKEKVNRALGFYLPIKISMLGERAMIMGAGASHA